VNDIRSTLDVNECFNHQDDYHGNVLSKYKDIINTIKNEEQKTGHTHSNKTFTQLSLRCNKINGRYHQFLFILNWVETIVFVIGIFCRGVCLHSSSLLLWLTVTDCLRCRSPRKCFFVTVTSCPFFTYYFSSNVCQWIFNRSSSCSIFSLQCSVLPAIVYLLSFGHFLVCLSIYCFWLPLLAPHTFSMCVIILAFLYQDECFYLSFLIVHVYIISIKHAI